MLQTDGLEFDLKLLCDKLTINIGMWLDDAHFGASLEVLSFLILPKKKVPTGQLKIRPNF